jgi:hypothetical protein
MRSTFARLFAQAVSLVANALMKERFQVLAG